MTALVEAAHRASRTKGSYFKDNSFASKHDGATCVPPWRSRTRSSAPSTRWSRLAPNIETSVQRNVIDTKPVTGNLVRRLQRLGYNVTIAARLPQALPAPPEPAG
jgi:hypothetical protein